MNQNVFPVVFRYSGTAPGPIRLSGSFNGWSPSGYLLRRTESGWAVTLFLPTGTYPYVFLVGDRLERTLDPARAGQDQPYSIVTVAPPGDNA
jgi:hypothetical protein